MTGPYDLSVEEYEAILNEAMGTAFGFHGQAAFAVFRINTLIESKRAQGDSYLMQMYQTYKDRWLSCVTPEEAQRLRDEIARLSKFEEYDKRLRESGARARANYSDDDWRNPST